MNLPSQDNTQTPLRIGALVSGGGRTVLNIKERIRDGSLNASIEVVICSKATAPAIERCRAAGLYVEVIERTAHDAHTFDDQIAQRLREHRCELVCMCGYNCLWQIPPDFAGRVINIHPALLPAYGGKGFYGRHVHRAVLEAGETISGCTVHYADNEYDCGSILLQETVPIEKSDNEDSLATKVFEQECITYPKAIAMIIDRRAPLPHPALAHPHSARTD